MRARNTCYVIFHKPDFGLVEAGAALSERGLQVKQENDILKVTWKDGPLLSVSFTNGKKVQKEAEILGRATRHYLALRDCDARFEIVCHDLEEVLNEINTLIELQITLQAVTQGFLFIEWNGQLISAAELDS